MSITTVVNKITNVMDTGKIGGKQLPPPLLKCVALKRTGLSAYKTTAKIIENNKKLGIETGPNPDGSQNKINQYTYNVVKEVFKALKEDAMVDVAIPQFSLLVETTGGNAGGPVICTGTNILDSIGNGIIQ